MCPASSQPQSLSPPGDPPDLWLCLRFNQLPLEALRERDRGVDFVYQQHRLVCVDQSARLQGLYPGMSVNQALMVAPGCSGRERDPQQEQQQLQALAHWAYHYTPQVSLGEQSVLLEVGHCLKLFRGFRRLYQQIEQDLLGFAVSARPGVAHTPAAAWVLSYAMNNGVQAAQGNATEPEVFLLLLGQASIDSLAIDTAIIRQLQSCGFENLEELLVAPREEIGERFGAPLMDYLARLLGEKDDPRPTIVPPQPFLLVQDFAEPIHNSQWIEHCTDDMLRQLCEFLRQRQYLCQLLVWRFYNDKTLIERLSIPLSSKHYGFDTFKQLTDLHIEKLTLGGELMRIELFSDRLLPAQLLIDDFFDPRIREQEASELVDKLATRLGEESVYQLACNAEPVPELSVLRTPFSPADKTVTRAPVNTTTPQSFQPLWLFTEPKALDSHRDNATQPLDHRRRPMQLIQGPDRIDSHWWVKNNTVATADPVIGSKHRDYYIARQQNGRLLWVFYERRLKRWFLHGLFG